MYALRMCIKCNRTFIGDFIMEKTERRYGSCKKTKKRTPEEMHRLTVRLNKIKGQIDAVQNMLEQDVYCTDVLIQISAAQGAFNSFTRELLSNHIQSCVVDEIRAGNDEVVEELLDILQKLL